MREIGCTIRSWLDNRPLRNNTEVINDLHINCDAVSQTLPILLELAVGCTPTHPFLDSSDFGQNFPALNRVLSTKCHQREPAVRLFWHRICCKTIAP